MVLDRNTREEVLFAGDYRGLKIYQLRGRVRPTKSQGQNEHAETAVQHTVKRAEGARELRLQ